MSEAGCGGIFCPIRHISPLGGSTLTTSAPKSDKMTAALGPAIKLAKSTTFKPEKILSVVFSVAICISFFVPSTRVFEINLGSSLNHSANVVLDEFEHLVATMVHDHPGHRQCESARFLISCFRRSRQGIWISGYVQ